MIKLLIPILFLWLIPAIVPAQHTSSVLLEINNISESGGTLRIGLFTDNDKFLEIPSYSKDIVITNEKSINVTFKDIPFGTYAFSVYHDLDNNEELDVNFIGIPKEPVGFSNDHQPKMGPPRFNGAAFSLKQKQLSMSVSLYTY